MNGTVCSQIGHLGPNLGLFRSEFLSVNRTICSQIGELGLFSSEFLSVNGTICSQIGDLGLFSSEFLSVNGTHCSQIGDWGIHFGPFTFALLYGPKLRCFFFLMKQIIGQVWLHLTVMNFAQ